MIEQALLKELKANGFIEECESGYIQTDDNCFEIAEFLAHKFGLRFPSSKKVLADMISNNKSNMLWANHLYREGITKAKAQIIIYQPDYIDGLVATTHVVFKKDDQEYNFGCSEEHGFEVSVRIPLLS